MTNLRGAADDPIDLDASSSGLQDAATSRRSIITLSSSGDTQTTRKRKADDPSPAYTSSVPGRTAVEPWRPRPVRPKILLPAQPRPIEEPRNPGDPRQIPPSVRRTQERSPYVFPQVSMIPPPPVPRPAPPLVAPPEHTAAPPRWDRVIFHPKPGHPLPPAGHPDHAPASPPFPPPAPAARPLLPSWTSVPPSDSNLPTRLHENASRPALPDTSTPPVWASKRRGLTSSLEYYAEPLRTSGGSIHVAPGGVARGIMFEGPLGDGYGFWGTGKSVGTFVVPFGNTRKRGTGRVPEDTLLQPVDSIPLPRHPTPPPDITASLDRILHPTDPAPAPLAPAQELPEIESLLRAHRARLPLAIGISEDWPLVPFRIARPFLILGWFWITDAWPEPTGAAWSDLEISQEALLSPGVEIRWRFRFDWCTSGQASHPWWESPKPDVVPLYTSLREPCPDRPWAVDGPDVPISETSLSPTAENKRIALNDRQDAVRDGWLSCTACHHYSVEVYNNKRYCLNVKCDQWFYDRSPRTDDKTPRRIILRAPRRIRRYTPDELGLHLRPPLPADPDPLPASDAGKPYWRGWVCPECGCANERKHWRGWDCEACTHKWYPDRRIWSADELVPVKRRDPHYNTLPSLDGQLARFSDDVVRSSMIWRDGTKACLYGLGNRNEVHLLLSSPTASSALKTNDILQLLQVKDHVNFRRTPDQQPGTRPTEKCYSPLYTFLAGPVETPMLEGLPSYKPVSWQLAPRVCIQAIGRMNDLCTRVIGDEKRFNSLLFVCPPPDLPAVLVPWIRVPQYSTFAVMYLGSKGRICTVEPDPVRKREPGFQGEVEVEHGDIVVVRTFEAELDLGLKPEGFGFFCVARQIYPPSSPAREGTGHPLTSLKRKEPPIIPREWPRAAVPKMDKSKITAEARTSEAAIEEQGWQIGNIPLWNRADHASLLTSSSGVLSA